MTIYDLIANTEFKNKHVLELLILEEFSRKDKTEIIKHYDDKLSNLSDGSDSFFENIKRKYELHTVEKQPIEYVLGYVEFFDRKFIVNENTLIPRPETEYMIEAVREFIKKHQKKTFLLDIGTGSGVLGISSYLENKEVISDICFTDLSTEALVVARQNFEILVGNNIGHTNVDFIQSDLLKNIKTYLIGKQGRSTCSTDRQERVFGEKNVVLVANLPYIPNATFDNDVEENVKKREPRMAFVGGNDGLDLYRHMFEQIRNLDNFKNIQKNKLTCFLEMMTWQVEILQAEFGNVFKFEEVKTFHFNIRIVKMSLK